MLHAVGRFVARYLRGLWSETRDLALGLLWLAKIIVGPAAVVYMMMMPAGPSRIEALLVLVGLILERRLAQIEAALYEQSEAAGELGAEVFADLPALACELNDKLDTLSDKLDTLQDTAERIEGAVAEVQSRVDEDDDLG